MIIKDLLPWMYVKRTAVWTPYVKIRAEGARLEASSLSGKGARKPGRRLPRGPA